MRFCSYPKTNTDAVTMHCDKSKRMRSKSKATRDPPYRAHRVSAFLCAGQSIQCVLENGHRVASLLCGHFLHINIELQPRALFVDEVTTFGEFVVKDR